MRLEVSLLGRTGRRRDIVVNADPRVPVGPALDGFARDAGKLYRGSEVLDTTDPIGRGSPRSGDVLSREASATRGWPLTEAAVGILGGAAAGQIRPVPLDAPITVGRGSEVRLRVDDPTVSTLHATVVVHADGSATVTDHRSMNGTLVGDRRVPAEESVTVPPGARFLLGQAVVQVLTPRTPDGVVHVDDEGQWWFNRVIGFRPPSRVTPVEIPAPPPDRVRGSFLAQGITSGVMLAGGVASAFVFRNPLYAVLGVLAPLAVIVSSLVISRGQRRQHRAAERRYDDASRRAEAELLTAAAEDADRAWRATIDPVDALLAATGPTSRLWSTDALDEHGFVLRVGTGDRLADVMMPNGSTRPAPRVVAAPVTLDLRATAVVGIAGPDAVAQGIARALVQQAAVSRSPDDLFVYHLAANPTSVGWSWLRWLPHVRGLDTWVHAVSPSASALTERLNELGSLIDQRLAVLGHGGRHLDQTVLPEVIVVLDGPGTLRSRASVVKVLRQGPSVGVRVVAIETTAGRLPAECTARILVDAERSVVTVERKGSEPVHDVTPDVVSAEFCERVARGLAPLLPLGGVESAQLPDRVLFRDLGTWDSGRPARVAAGWSVTKEATAVLGVGEESRAVSVDLVEDGPHVLIAGTSGAGKSELMRSLLAGLALSSAPDALSFFLIDYKGGGAFGKLQNLPHVVGYADDLMIGGRLADRLLRSLEAELERRKRLFRDGGQADGIDEYRTRRAARPDLPPVSRLVVVVDEFAELMQAQPDFIDGLVQVARTGRSLGVHLVLATQQPAGVVKPQIRDNASLRICLRVLDASTSTDLVDSPVAGAFPLRAKGRAAIRTSDGVVVVQTAYLTAPRRVGRAGDIPKPVIEELAWSMCGLPRQDAHRAERSGSTDTDLEVFCADLAEAAAVHAMPGAHRPWLPPLPEHIAVADLGESHSPDVAAVFAIEDRPEEQSQPTIGLVLGRGNTTMVGGQGSGRTTALRTIAGVLASRWSADEVHIHAVDWSATPGLAVLEALPHSGVVVRRGQAYRAARLVLRLVEQLVDRSAMVGARGVASWRELPEGDRPPAVVVLIDGYDRFFKDVVTASNAVREGISRLLTEGPGLGVQFVVTGDRTTAQSGVTASSSTLLVMGFEQRDDVHGYGVPLRDIPVRMAPGRALLPGSGRAVQVLTLSADPTTEAQVAAVREIAARSVPVRRNEPVRIDELPGVVDVTTARTLEPRPSVDGWVVVVGVGGDALAAHTVDLAVGRRVFVVIGAERTGRSTTLASIAAQLVQSGVPVAFIRGQRATDVAPPGVVELPRDNPGDLPLAGVVVVDDADLWAGDDWLDRAMANPSVSLVIAGAPAGLTGYVGWRSQLGGAEGLLLSPAVNAGDAIGLRVTLEDAFTGPPGRAYLRRPGRVVMVQVPVPVF